MVRVGVSSSDGTSSPSSRVAAGSALVAFASSLAGVTSVLPGVLPRGRAGGPGGCRRGGLRGALGGGPALLLRDLEAEQGGGPGADALVGQAVVEAGEHPAHLLEGADAVGAAGGAHVLAGAQVVDELHGGLGRLVVEELPVGHDDGGVVARRVALDPLEGDLAVVGRLVVAHAEVLGDGVPDLVAAHDRAQRVGADADGVLAVGVALVLRVERRDPGDLRGRQVEQLGAQVDAAAGDVAVDRLHEVQQREQRRALLGVAGDDLGGVGAELRLDVRRVGLLGLLTDREVTGCGLEAEVVGHQRSTPPMTGSMEATATMTSATWAPSHIAATACRLLKLGSRKCAR